MQTTAATIQSASLQYREGNSDKEYHTTTVTARKLLTRLRFERLTLPVLNHVLATIDNAGLTPKQIRKMKTVM